MNSCYKILDNCHITCRSPASENQMKRNDVEEGSTIYEQIGIRPCSEDKTHPALHGLPLNTRGSHRLTL